MRSVITFAAAAIVAGLVVPQFAAQMRLHTHRPAATHAARPAQPAPQSSNGYSVEVPRDELGHFRVDGQVNGRTLRFLIDTGASVVALTADDAALLGIRPLPRDFTVTVKTANGTVRAAPTQLGLVEVGNIQLNAVTAVVMPDGALSDNLLGLSFLERLRHFTYSDGEMILEQ